MSKPLLVLHFLVPLLLVQLINVTAESQRSFETAYIAAVKRCPQHQHQRQSRVTRLLLTPVMLGVVPNVMLHTMNIRQRHNQGFLVSDSFDSRTSFGTITSLAAGTNDGDNDDDELSTTTTTKAIDPIKSYGFDNPPPQQQPSKNTQKSADNNRLRRSLDDSAKFKVKNDARFAWLTTLAVSCAYAYGCLGGEDGQEILAIAGIPNGGTVGGVVGVLGGIGSVVLFFAPELFGKRGRGR